MRSYGLDSETCSLKPELRVDACADRSVRWIRLVLAKSTNSKCKQTAIDTDLLWETSRRWTPRYLLLDYSYDRLVMFTAFEDNPPILLHASAPLPLKGTAWYCTVLEWLPCRTIKPARQRQRVWSLKVLTSFCGCTRTFCVLFHTFHGNWRTTNFMGRLTCCLQRITTSGTHSLISKATFQWFEWLKIEVSRDASPLSRRWLFQKKGEEPEFAVWLGVLYTRVLQYV